MIICYSNSKKLIHGAASFSAFILIDWNEKLIEQKIHLFQLFMGHIFLNLSYLGLLHTGWKGLSYSHNKIVLSSLSSVHQYRFCCCFFKQFSKNYQKITNSPASCYFSIRSLKIQSLVGNGLHQDSRGTIWSDDGQLPNQDWENSHCFSSLLVIQSHILRSIICLSFFVSISLTYNVSLAESERDSIEDKFHRKNYSSFRKYFLCFLLFCFPLIPHVNTPK